MFRASRKKPQATKSKRLTEPDSENESGDDGPAVVVKPAGKKNRRRRPVIRSFDGPEGEDEGPSTILGRKDRAKREIETDRRDKVKRRRGDLRKKSTTRSKFGLGYGGFSLKDGDPDDDGDERDVETMGDGMGMNNNAISSSLYDKDAIAQLRAEQKYRKTVRDETPEAEEGYVKDSSTGSILGPDRDRGDHHQKEPRGKKDGEHDDGDHHPLGFTQDSKPQESFIPLTGGENFRKMTAHETPEILTGDDAFHFEEDVRVNHDGALRSNEQDIRSDASPTDWEQEVTRRAGLSSSSSSSVHASTTSSIRRKFPSKDATTTKTTSSMTALRQQVQQTLSQLQSQQEDIQQAINRRQVDLNQTQQELTRQEADLDQSGKAMEFYQELRIELAEWAGAMRDLKSRMTPIRDALRDLDKKESFSLHGQRWMELQNDVAEILQEAGCLQQVVGRQPPPVRETDRESSVDEFGRDIKSQHLLQRENRIKTRRQIRHERSTLGRDGDGDGADESDAFMTLSEIQELKERRKALEEALTIAKDEVDDYYTSVTNLTSIFEKWRLRFPEEYKDCFAGMSLGDLVSVLVHVDLCSSLHHPLRGDTAFAGANVMQMNALQTLSDTVKTDSHEEVEEAPLYRMADKVLIPAVDDILDGNAYNLASQKQSRSLAAFVSFTCEILPKSSLLVEKLLTRLAQYVRAQLGDIAIPIVTPPVSPPSVDLKEALRYATSGQLSVIERLLENVLEYWFPLLGDRLAEAVLDFVSSPFLFLLSSLQAHNQHGSGGGGNVVKLSSIHGLWSLLEATEWLQKPEYFLQAAPIRAAALAYPSSFSESLPE